VLVAGGKMTEELLRKKAVRNYVLSCQSPKEIYISLNRSKTWFFKWLKRYKTGDTDWCKNKQRRHLNY